MNQGRKIKPRRNFLEGIVVALVIFIIGVFGFIFSSITYFRPPKRVDLITIKEVVQNNPKITDGGKMNDFIDLRLQLTEEFTFNIVGVAFEAANTDELIKNVKKGDTIEIQILRSEYLKKIIRNQKLVLTDRFGWRTIEIRDLKKGNEIYLKFEDYAKKTVEKAKYNIEIALIFVFIGLVWFMVVYRKSKTQH